MNRFPRGLQLRVTLALGLLIVAGPGVAACSSSPPSPGGVIPKVGASSSSATDVSLTALVEKVDARPHPQAGGAIRADATGRPTVTPAGNGRWRTMVIRDEDASPWLPGTYRLDVSCAGVGTLVAFLGIGENAQIKELTPCRTDIATDSVTVEVPHPSRQGTVVITPVGETKAAVAYQIVKE